MSDTILRKQHVAETQQGIGDDLLTFVFSDSSIDAYDDVIDQRGWDLSDFRKNPICLLGHDPHFVIGRWTDVRIENNKLKGRLLLAPAGASQRINEVRTLVAARILRAVSVGFYPLEWEPRPGSTRGGRCYTRQALRECSIVSVPANSNALLEEAKSLGISNDVIKRVFRPSLDANLSERQAHARAALARARSILAKSKAREILEKSKAREAAEKRKPGELSPKAQAVYDAWKAERAKQKAAVATDYWGRELYPGEARPSMTFGGQPIYWPKNEYGW